jgi:hypothetical protein
MVAAKEQMTPAQTVADSDGKAAEPGAGEVVVDDAAAGN